ncbi:hypothetical protein Bbelb_304740 [Branchiostoma belcheri]|nr:hypothetical protein Bbelb_304740 [Branchiostoma belcheri]
MEGLIHAQDVRIPPEMVLHLAITENQAARFPSIDRLLQGTGLTLDIIQKRLMIACLEGTRPERVVSAAQIIHLYSYFTAEVLLFMSGMLCSIPLRNFGRAYHELQRASVEAMELVDFLNASGDSNARMETLMEEAEEEEEQEQEEDGNGDQEHEEQEDEEQDDEEEYEEADEEEYEEEEEEEEDEWEEALQEESFD